MSGTDSGCWPPPSKQSLAETLTRTLQHKTLDMITLFHKASSPASVRLAAALRQASAVASETSTADQASDHSAQTKEATSRPEFQLEVTETPPTTDQLRTILGYVGGDRISTLVKGATDEQEALRKYAENVENLQRPVVCLLFLFSPLLCLFHAFVTSRSSLFFTLQTGEKKRRSLTNDCRLSTGTMARWEPGRMNRRFSRCSISCRNKPAVQVRCIVHTSSRTIVHADFVCANMPLVCSMSFVC